MASTDVVGNVFAGDHDDLEVLLVYPDATLVVALVFLDGFGRSVEDVCVELVDLLSADVGDVVLWQIFSGEDEGETVLEVVEVLASEDEALDGVLRGEDDVFVASTVFVEADVGDLVILAVGTVIVVVDGLHLYVLAEGVVLAGLGEDGLFGGETFDDLLGRDAGWWSGIDFAEAAVVLRVGGEAEESQRRTEIRSTEIEGAPLSRDASGGCRFHGYLSTLDAFASRESREEVSCCG